jgi:hypothetical protein
MDSEIRAGVTATCPILEQGEPWTDLRLTSGQSELTEQYKTTYPEPVLQPGGPHQLCCRGSPGHQPSPSSSRTFIQLRMKKCHQKRSQFQYISFKFIPEIFLNNRLSRILRQSSILKRRQHMTSVNRDDSYWRARIGTIYTDERE